MGKSVIGLQQAYESARQGVEAAYFSLETSKAVTSQIVSG